MLAIENGVDINRETGKHSLLSHLEEEGVAVCHRGEHGVQLEVSAQVCGVGGWRAIDVDVAVAMQEKDLHRSSLFSKRALVTPCFSASDIA